MILSRITPTCKSPIGYLGGKTRLRSTIYSCMPKHECYVEVFGGSAVVFWGKPSRMSKIEIINDIDKELMNFMKVISGTYFKPEIREEFISYVRKMPASRAAYKEWQKWLNINLKISLLDELNSAQRAFVFYYCTKKGFSSMSRGGYEASPLAGSRYNQNTDFEVFIKRFSKSNAQIECLDFKELIEKYNRSEAMTFFFGDPPYWVANDKSYYRYFFTQEQHQQLKECCDQIHKNKNTFLLTYDDVEDVILLYKDYYIYRTDPIIYSAADERGNRGIEKKELFITNYDISQLKSSDFNYSFDDSDNDNNIIDKRIDISGCIGLERIN